MEIEIIPAINADNFEEIKQKIKLLEPYVKWVQLDVADGTMTPNTIWHNAKDLNFIQTPLNIEVHLMINNIEKRINEWLIPNVKRIIFHISSSANPDLVINKCKEAGKETGIAVGPDESLLRAMHYKGKIDMFQILGVPPGLPGQKMERETLERIKELRKFCQSCIIEIDGGVNKDNAKELIDAGANILTTASAIFNGDDIEKNLKNLNGALN